LAQTLIKLLCGPAFIRHTPCTPLPPPARTSPQRKRAAAPASPVGLDNFVKSVANSRNSQRDSV
jgi:hypothetical protein